MAYAPSLDVGDLFSSLSDAEHFGDLAFVGHYDGDAGLAEVFAEAAEAIFSSWQGGVLTALHEHASFLREIRAEYGA